MVQKGFRLGPRVRYPIVISKFLKKKGENVDKQEAILEYTYKYERTIGDPDLGEERVIEQTGYAEWDCPTEGTIVQWKVNEGDNIARDQPLVVIDEVCPHDQQFAGLCVLCGKDMKEVSWASDGVDADRATISMVHDNVSLTVSAAQATRAELALQKRLLEQKKLSLVVDLDQTIIHACIEPTIGEWQRDPTNPNYDAVKDVRTFQLDDGPRGLTNGCWYYIKLRPGLAGFLERMSELFEMHVYTMGTRAYAEQIANIVDPDKKLFGHRIISRDENGSMTAKSLQRLFPVSTNMVVVIDDRADVWPRNRPNLIKVTPYDFFKGIGDINSSFLPKREDLLTPEPSPDSTLKNGATPESSNIPPQANISPQQKQAAASGSDESTILQLQAEEQERALEKQIKERPLLHMQEELDKEDSEAEKSDSTSDSPNDSLDQNGHSTDSHSHQRHNLLRDDDQELEYLENHLTTLHENFYEQYEARRASRYSKHSSRNDITPDTIPDVGFVLDRLKSRVLRDCTIVLSGLVPLGIDVLKSELGLQCTSFGATLKTRVSDKVTHLVISNARPRTQKVRQAARIPSIKIVNQDWLANSLAQWIKLDEQPYLVQVHPADRAGATGELQVPKITTFQAGKEVFGNDQALADQDQNVNGTDLDDSASDDDTVDDNDGADSDDEDLQDLMPSDDGMTSPVDGLKKMDWGDMDEELKEFMGSDMDSDSDSGSEYVDSDADDATGDSDHSKKRGAEDDIGSTLAKKQRLAKQRTTGLRNVKNMEDDEGADGSGLPTPQGTGDEDGEKDGEAGDGEDDGFDDLEAELEAELAAEALGEKG